MKKARFVLWLMIITMLLSVVLSGCSSKPHFSATCEVLKWDEVSGDVTIQVTVTNTGRKITNYGPTQSWFSHESLSGFDGTVYQDTAEWRAYDNVYKSTMKKGDQAVQEYNFAGVTEGEYTLSFRFHNEQFDLSDIQLVVGAS